MGFLGTTAEITGFVIDPPVLIGCLFFASLFQLMKNEAEKKKPVEDIE